VKNGLWQRLVTSRYRILQKFPRIHLWLIKRKDERNYKILKEKYYPLIDAHKKAKKFDEERHATSDFLDEKDLIFEPTYALEAQVLETKARKLGIRVPDKPNNEEQENEDWRLSRTTYQWILSGEAERKRGKKSERSKDK